jgi:uncharacterized delta-60 repeat protein
MITNQNISHMKAFSIIITSLLFTGISVAQDPGSLNTAFGTGGAFTGAWGDTLTQANDMGIQWNGNILLAGHLIGGDPREEQIFVMELSDEGDILPFGNTSRGFVYDLADMECATSLVVLPDDNILVAGYYVQEAEHRPFVIRLLSTGELDETFADHGVFSDGDIVMDIHDIDVFGNPESYKIILAGKDDSGYPRLMVIDQSGNADNSFGTDGMVRYEGRLGYYSKMIVDLDNHKLYTCMTLIDGKTALAKYDLPGGTPDAAFGTAGIVSSESFEDLELIFNNIVFDPGNNLLAAFGNYRHTAGDMDMCALRVNASSGVIDLTFGVNGWAWLRNADHDENLFAAIMQSDGKYCIGGYSDYNGNDDFMLGRLNVNGTADATFGNNGLVLSAAPYDNRIGAMVLSPTENILYAAGFSLGTDWKALNVAAYYTGYESEPSAIKEDRLSPVTIYPNPASDYTTITTELYGTHNLQILDIAGHEINTIRYRGDPYELDLSGLRPSLYILRLTLPEGQIQYYKLIKE